jgi:Helix-turn-helix domain
MLNIVLNDAQLNQLALQISSLLQNAVANDSNELLTSKDVLKLCSVTKPTLFAWRESGKIPFKKVGNKIYYQKKDVLSLVRA